MSRPQTPAIAAVDTGGDIGGLSGSIRRGNDGRTSTLVSMHGRSLLKIERRQMNPGRWNCLSTYLNTTDDPVVAGLIVDSGGFVSRHVAVGAEIHVPIGRADVTNTHGSFNRYIRPEAQRTIRSSFSASTESPTASASAFG